jgi:hypothetical protein
VETTKSDTSLESNPGHPEFSRTDTYSTAMFECVLNESSPIFTSRIPTDPWTQQTRKRFPVGLCDITEIKERKFRYNTKINIKGAKTFTRPRHSSSGYSLASHGGGPGASPESSHVGFVVDKVALGQVISDYFGFSCQSSFHQFLHNHPHLSSGAYTTGQKSPQYLGT